MTEAAVSFWMHTLIYIHTYIYMCIYIIAEGDVNVCALAPKSAVVGLCRLRLECALQMAVIMIR